MKRDNVIAVLGFVIAEILFIYLSLHFFMIFTMNVNFPILQFLLTFILLIGLSWFIGLSIKKYINKIAGGNKKVKANLTMIFIIGTVLATFSSIGLFFFIGFN